MHDRICNGVYPILHYHGGFIMRTHLLGFPTALGLPRPVAEHAPSALRRIGVAEALRTQGFQVNDLGDIPVAEANRADDVDLRIRKVLHAARQQADTFCKAFSASSLPITLGGDHSTSLGTVMALHELGHTFDVIWIDAHADFNTLATSPSGNPHGMVLAMLTGLTPYLPAAVQPDQLRLWGVRDVDSGERLLLQEHHVQVLDVPGTRLHWRELLNALGPNVFLSFDCDSCQPGVAPGTMTPVPNGFERQEALDLVREICETRNVLALDVVELHPDRDVADQTALLARDVILTAAMAQSRFRATAAAHA